MTYTLENAHVVVVEDMAPMLELTVSILKTFGFTRVEGFRDAGEAFDYIISENPDVIITDWLMEPMNGIELIRKIRTSDNSPNPYIPVVLMTGYSDRARVEMARDSGVTEFLMKPYSAKDLYSRIVQIIEKPRQFVDAGTFFGPDRRRRKNFDYSGPLRREQDQDAPDPESAEKRKMASQILDELRSNGKNG